MNRLAILAVGAGALGAVAAGCSSSSTPSSTPSTSSSPPAASSGAATVKAAGSSLGQILVDGSGRTLYLYKPDTGTTPTCTGSCASTWPADTTTGKPQESGLTASMLGTTTRPDNHASQVTFDGHPLYYFSGDSKPGDVNGQDTMGIWFAVSPSGSAITTGHTPAPTPSTSSGGGGGYGY
jgi:predicted lipoprotein with Yx(FWY)xxD motif